jgi:hypothetical protein
MFVQLLGLLQQPDNLSSFTRHVVWADTQAAAACWLQPALAPATAKPVRDLAAAGSKLPFGYTRLDCAIRLVLLKQWQYLAVLTEVLQLRSACLLCCNFLCSDRQLFIL